jgi:hypothetical protein
MFSLKGSQLMNRIYTQMRYSFQCSSDIGESSS